MRVAIVNDLRMAQEILCKSVALMADASVAWIAADGVEALAACKRDRPDLILMDMVMPVMDGAVATRAIMKECPCPILVVTSTIEGNLSLVYEALSAGAIDAVQTPQIGAGGTITGIDTLNRKARIALASIASAASARPSAVPLTTRAATTARSKCVGSCTPLLAIGSSTGGPHALSVVLRGLTNHATHCTVIVQHIDISYAAGLATWLSGETKKQVRIAVDGDSLQPGLILVAASDDHLVICQGRVHYVREPVDEIYRPSVDALFRSVAGDASLIGAAVLLTGMGRDGADGLRVLRASGWQTLAQDQNTSVVWGMPGAAVALGAAGQVLPLDLIGGAASRAIAAAIAAS
ncbi:MAG: chemotaxis-specific protein-glutamate methyltransferase CheB [Phycisphaerales bacterium]|nr:chemotaxis-specific protein-glutamate methyltransferase CheB [Phycisphaerales bacterium]